MIIPFGLYYSHWATADRQKKACGTAASVWTVSDGPDRNEQHGASGELLHEPTPTSHTVQFPISATHTAWPHYYRRWARVIHTVDLPQSDVFRTVSLGFSPFFSTPPATFLAVRSPASSRSPETFV